MELLGVGPGEILLILVIMLLVFGPERLPEMARQAGRFVVGIRDWIQRSPDAALILRAREDLETELQSLRAELTREVESVRQDLQTVRSDLVDASKMLEQSAQEVANTSKISLTDAGSGATVEPSIKPPVASSAPVQSAPAATAVATDSSTPSPTTQIAGGDTIARGASATKSSVVTPVAAATDATAPATGALASSEMTAIDALSKQVAAIAEELARLRVNVLRRAAEEKQQAAALANTSATSSVSESLNGSATARAEAVASDNGAAVAAEVGETLAPADAQALHEAPVAEAVASDDGAAMDAEPEESGASLAIDRQAAVAAEVGETLAPADAQALHETPVAEAVASDDGAAMDAEPEESGASLATDRQAAVEAEAESMRRVEASS